MSVQTQGECLFLKYSTGYLSAGAWESWDRLCPGLRLWDRKGQQACPVAGFQHCGTCGHDGIVSPHGTELPAGQRGQGRNLPLLQSEGIHTPTGEIRCHLDSVGLWLVLNGIASAILPFPDREEENTWG